MNQTYTFDGCTIRDLNVVVPDIKAGGAEPRPGTLGSAALLIDRSKQAEAVRASLKRLRAEDGRRPPLLVVLPGPAHGNHGSFVARFGTHDLRRVLRDEEQEDCCDYLQCMDWPTSNKIDDILGPIRDLLCLPSQCDDPTEFKKRLGGELPKSLCFGHRVTPAVWSEQGDLVREWVDFVCDEWPQPANRHMVVAFLLIELPATTGIFGSWRARALNHFVSTLEKRMDTDPRIVVAPRLGMIERKDVDFWITSLKTLCGDDHSLVYGAQPLPEHLFGGNVKQRTFSDVYAELHSFLSRATRTQ
ncbi:MAG: hypothetical protein HQL39_04165 [Alphaproteobacteria bacterium]|nr:hypothetical protein [Alphaproteobacteria bacterium]